MANTKIEGNPLPLAERVRVILSAIRYKDWNVRMHFEHNIYYLQVHFVAKDTQTNKEDSLQSGRKWLLSPHMTDSEIVQTAYLAVKTAEEHEILENFLLDGQPIFCPHMNLFELNKCRLQGAIPDDVRVPVKTDFSLPFTGDKNAAFHAKSS
jgi:hypothetical protein